MSSFLDDIVQLKYNEVQEQLEAEPLDELQRKIEDVGPVLDFATAIRTPKVPGPLALIAEIKKSSPSAGEIIPNFDPVAIADAYAHAGASAISVLTDTVYFKGKLSYIEIVKKATDYKIPILRKDFIIDSYQVWQSRAYGADAILIILSIVTETQAKVIYRQAMELGLHVVVEAYTAEEVRLALRLGAPIIGFNNRNLSTLEVNLDNTRWLSFQLPQNWSGTIISESGIKDQDDLKRMYENGANAVLIGESLLRAGITAYGTDSYRMLRQIARIFQLAFEN